MTPRMKRTLTHPIFVFTLGLSLGFLAAELRSLVKILVQNNNLSFSVKSHEEDDPFALQQKRMRQLMEDQLKMFGGLGSDSAEDEENGEPTVHDFSLGNQEIQTESLPDKVIFRVTLQDPRHHKVTVKAEQGMLHVTISYDSSTQGSGGGAVSQFHSEKMLSLEPDLDTKKMTTELQGQVMVITIPRQK